MRGGAIRENPRNDERGEVEDGKELSSQSRKSRQEISEAEEPNDRCQQYENKKAERGALDAGGLQWDYREHHLLISSVALYQEFS